MASGGWEGGIAPNEEVVLEALVLVAHVARVIRQRADVLVRQLCLHGFAGLEPQREGLLLAGLVAHNIGGVPFAVVVEHSHLFAYCPALRPMFDFRHRLLTRHRCQTQVRCWVPAFTA